MKPQLQSLPANFGKTTISTALGTTSSIATVAVMEGARHNSLVSYAGQVRNLGMVGETLRLALHERNNTYFPPLPAEEVDRIASDADEWDGRDDYVCNQAGKISANNFANIRAGLAKLGLQLSYCSFTHTPMVNGKRLDDNELRRIWFLFERQLGFRPTKEFLREALLEIAQQNAFNPVCQLLEKFQNEWDGTPRFGNWLTIYLGAPDTELNRTIGRIILMAIVRRARQPGCKFDTMPIFIGPQGCGKSTIVRLLALMDEWFSDYLSFSAEGREMLEMLAGRLVVEIGELSGMRKANSEQLKSQLSRQNDSGRPAYATMVQTVPRSCVFIGTTNNAAFLTDGTGGRRFWPIEVGTILLEQFARDRNQLIGEAAHYEASGESITLPAELWAAAAAITENRRVENPITSLLDEAFGDIQGRIRSTAVWELLNIPTAQQQSMASTISSAMQELGWTAGKHRFGKDTARGFKRGDGPQLCKIANRIAPKFSTNTSEIVT